MRKKMNVMHLMNVVNWNYNKHSKGLTGGV